MQVNSNHSSNMLKELLNTKGELQDASIKKSKISPIVKTHQEISSQSNPLQERQTYGLLVLELMSEPEYNAFKRATAGMSEGEKIVAAQSLYSLTSFYSGKIANKPLKYSYGNTLGIQNQDFIERYKNAFASQNKIDIVS